MIKFTFLLVVFAAASSYGQIVIPSLRNRLEFPYDVSGNQTKRELKRTTYVPVDPIISVTQSRKVSATAEEKEGRGLGQTLPIDAKWNSSVENSALKYFPNPVQDVLYVQWEELERDMVMEIHLYTIKGLFLSKKSISGQDLDFPAFLEYGGNVEKYPNVEVRKLSNIPIVTFIESKIDY